MIHKWAAKTVDVKPWRYGRVDLVRDNHGNFAVIELELIEPELWLRNHLPAATAFADAIAKFVLA